MADESTQIIVGDAMAAASEEMPRRRRPLWRRKPAAEERLTHCQNCGAPLTGPYCGQCGQHAIDYRRSIGQLVVDAADSLFNWDTKFLQSIGVLLWKPWKLTNEFNAGKRVRYIHPLRLYLLASVVFFLLMRLISGTPESAVTFDENNRAELAQNLGELTGSNSPLNEEQRARIEAIRSKLAGGQEPLTVEERDFIRTSFADFIRFNIRSRLAPEQHRKIPRSLAAVPVAKEERSPLPQPSDATAATEETRSDAANWIEQRVKEKVGKDGTKAGLFLETLRSNIPAMMLFCVPIFALLLKILYFRQHRYYIEHLVYAVHIHSFLYMGVVVIALINITTSPFAEALSTLVTTGLSLALLIQVLRSIRFVYQQGWLAAVLKFLIGGFCYLMVLAVGVAATALATLLLP